MYNAVAIATINRLLHENTDASLTYAALECRLAIELICYSRLRVAHDYISQDDLRAWQPKQVIDALIQEVDPRAGSTFTLSISQEPLWQDATATSTADYEKMNWVEIGTQIGFDPKKLGKLWNKLANVALHVTIPQTSKDELRRYGDPQLTREAVLEALAEIKRIDVSTLASGGTGTTMSFTCSCGVLNKRRKTLLKDNQIVNCISPKCYESYIYLDGSEEFRTRSFRAICAYCSTETFVPSRYMEKNLKVGATLRIRCQCGGETYIEWRLMQAQKPTQKHT